MPSGRLGAVLLSTTSETSIYAPPSTKKGVFTINVCNVGSSIAKVKLALTTGGTATSATYLEFNKELAPGEVLERTGVVLANPNVLTAQADVANQLTVLVYGIEEAI